MQYLVALILLLVLIIDGLSALIGRWLRDAREHRAPVDRNSTAAVKKSTI